MPKTVALDVGDATIGVASTDEMQISVNPIRTIKRSNSIKADLREVETLLAELEADEVVVGLPLMFDDTEGPQALKVRDFYDRLVRRLRIPVVLWDERFSTAEAEEMLLEADLSRAKRREVIDQAAAMVILQSYLRSKK